MCYLMQFMKGHLLYVLTHILLTLVHKTKDSNTYCPQYTWTTPTASLNPYTVRRTRKYLPQSADGRNRRRCFYTMPLRGSAACVLCRCRASEGCLEVSRCLQIKEDVQGCIRWYIRGCLWVCQWICRCRASEGCLGANNRRWQYERESNICVNQSNFGASVSQILRNIRGCMSEGVLVDILIVCQLSFPMALTYPPLSSARKTGTAATCRPRAE